ncbi:hypothetical protein SEA_MAGRITTE_88 [Microbacterium phage Magritte]|nr:hypothetical protein SEA_MAGRITTE_88 [Microbacterium phage Magritte]
MGTTAHRDGRVTAEIGEVDVHIGTVTKDDDGDWTGDCALCEDGVMSDSKAGAVDGLEEHFVLVHTTPNI